MSTELYRPQHTTNGVSLGLTVPLGDDSSNEQDYPVKNSAEESD